MVIAKTMPLYKLYVRQFDKADLSALLKHFRVERMNVRILYEQDGECQPCRKIGSFDAQPATMASPQSPDSSDQVGQYIMIADGKTEMNVSLYGDVDSLTHVSCTGVPRHFEKQLGDANIKLFNRIRTKFVEQIQKRFEQMKEAVTFIKNLTKENKGVLITGGHITTLNVHIYDDKVDTNQDSNSEDIVIPEAEVVEDGNPSEADIRNKILGVRPLIKNKRLWFPVCKYLMRYEIVPEGDFVGAVAYLDNIIPGLMLDAKDLNRMNVQSFSKPFEYWTRGNAPVKGGTYKDYEDIVEYLLK